MQTENTGVGSGTVATDETDRLIASDKSRRDCGLQSNGRAPWHGAQRHIDKYTGQVAYAVMSFGGFLGIGESYHPLPWRVLTYDTRQGGYVVDLDRSRLEGAPSYTTSNMPNWSDQSYQRRIDEYYSMPSSGGI